MNSTHAALFRVWMLTLLVKAVVFGQPVSVPRAAAPTITILSASTGAPVRSEGTGNASLDLGQVSYFKGTSVPGESSQKNPKSFVISTRFALRVDCPGRSSSSQVSVTVARPDAAASHTIRIDGTALGPAEQTLTQSMPCGSASEHRLEVEVPVSIPAGSIGSTVAFLATLKK